MSKNNNGEIEMTADHHPFPTSKKPWLLKQTWHDTLFIHWPVPTSTLQAFIPKSLQIDLFENQAWIGVIPLMMNNSRIHYTPALPLVSNFPGLNIRTYVMHNGKPGVYFLNLYAASYLVAKCAHQFMHLPYFHADFQFRKNAEKISFSCQCKSEQGKGEFVANYYPISKPTYAKSGSLEYWLTERYYTYIHHAKQLYQLEIFHHPWLLQKAEAEIRKNTMLDFTKHNFNTESILQYAAHQKTVMWGIEKINPTFQK